VSSGHLASDVGPCIARCLRSKGFCVVTSDTNEALQQDVLTDIRALVAEDRFQQPPRLVADGLLGESGSARIAELEAPDDHPEGSREALKFADSLISKMGIMMEPAVESELGLSLVGRTAVMVHETAKADPSPPALTEAEAATWLGTFVQAKFMVLFFFGPGAGTLDIRVAGEEDMDPYEIQTQPGMMVILRADSIIHDHSGPEGYVLSSFFFAEKTHWYKNPSSDALPPAAQQLDRWIVNRMIALKRNPDSTPETAIEPDIPREVQRSMNRMFLKGDRAAIRGVCSKLASTHGFETFRSTMVCNADFGTDVPTLRWEHQEHYHPDLESYHYGKVYCMHMTFVPELDLFDNKFFLISPAEASRMDPCERQLLEMSYEAFADAGVKKRELMGGDCGIYVAWNSDFQGIQDRGMGANRVSFCLGMKGPSLACDVDHASALVAMKIACNELGRACNQGITLGCTVCLKADSWLVHCGAHLLSPAGRTCSFDANASGFIRGDGIAGAYIKPLATRVDEEEVWIEGKKLYGVVQAATCKNQGSTASLRAITGPCLQEVLAESLRLASISPLDIDIVECDAKGNLMNEAVEVSSVVRTLRPKDDALSEPVSIGAVKTSIGNSWVSTGMASLMKALVTGNLGTVAPSNHINQINPFVHTEYFERPLLIPYEAMETNSDVTYTGVTGCGWGGTNAHLVIWSRANEAGLPTGTPGAAKPEFWPGGGGVLEYGQTPSRMYTIVGTWSSWQDPAEMEDEGDGFYGCTVTLGENCWEMFQIWLDGNEDMVLHPGYAKAPKATPVKGPDRIGVQDNWLIDGRAVYGLAAHGAEGTPAEEGDLGDEGAIVEMDTADRGWPGAEYRVRLQVAGRWRSVSWERVSERPAVLPKMLPDSLAGRYFVTGSFNYWEFSEMSPDLDTPGVYRAEVALTEPSMSFQVVRNKDWHQAFYPAGFADSFDAHGPSDEGRGLYWRIFGRPGEVYNIQFQRCHDETGWDTARVSWQRDHAKLPDGSARRLPRKYFVIGSWDDYRSKAEMLPDDSGNYVTQVEMPAGLKASFQILVDGDWSAVLHPSRANAGPHAAHRLFGPSQRAEGLCWTIGEDPEDKAEEGRVYDVTLGCVAGAPRAVTWSCDAAGQATELAADEE